MLGDYIFKVSVSKRFSDDLSMFFKKNQNINQENNLELDKLCSRKDSTKITLMRSKREADKIRIKFNKHFYIKK